MRGVCIIGGQNDPAHGWFWFYEKWTKLQFRILQIMWTNAAVFDLKLEVIMSLCTFWSDWIIFPFHFWQNWSEMNKLGAKMFPHHHIKEKTTFFFQSCYSQPRPHQTFKATCQFVPYTCRCHGNSSKQPCPARRPQQGADSNIWEHLVIKNIIYLNRVWCRAIAVGVLITTALQLLWWLQSLWC